MGAIVPTITSLTSAITAVDTLIGTVQGFGGIQDAEQRRKQQSLALSQLKEQQAAQTRNLTEQTALQREKIQADTAAAERERQAALRRAVARQKASFGAKGIDASDGSAEAVLLGLFDESDEERQNRERLDELRNRVLDQESEAQNRLNVLQASQLRQRQQLERAVKF